MRRFKFIPIATILLIELLFLSANPLPISQKKDSTSEKKRDATNVANLEDNEQNNFSGLDSNETTTSLNTPLNNTDHTNQTSQIIELSNPTTTQFLEQTNEEVDQNIKSDEPDETSLLNIPNEASTISNQSIKSDLEVTEQTLADNDAITTTESIHIQSSPLSHTETTTEIISNEALNKTIEEEQETTLKEDYLTSELVTNEIEQKNETHNFAQSNSTVPTQSINETSLTTEIDVQNETLQNGQILTTEIAEFNTTVETQNDQISTTEKVELNSPVFNDVNETSQNDQTVEFNSTILNEVKNEEIPTTEIVELNATEFNESKNETSQNDQTVEFNSTILNDGKNEEISTTEIIELNSPVFNDVKNETLHNGQILTTEIVEFNSTVLNEVKNETLLSQNEQILTSEVVELNTTVFNEVNNNITQNEQTTEIIELNSPVLNEVKNEEISTTEKIELNITELNEIKNETPQNDQISTTETVEFDSTILNEVKNEEISTTEIIELNSPVFNDVKNETLQNGQILTTEIVEFNGTVFNETLQNDQILTTSFVDLVDVDEELNNVSISDNLNETRTENSIELIPSLKIDESIVEKKTTLNKEEIIESTTTVETTSNNSDSEQFESTTRIETSTENSTEESQASNDQLSNWFKSNNSTRHFQPGQISLEIKNFSVINPENSEQPNNYSLRIRIKGYKWNNQFTDVNSLESQELLRSKILPLLYESLNLKPDEVNEIKLLRLFKGSVQSDLTFKSNIFVDLNSTILNRTFEFVNEAQFLNKTNTRFNSSSSLDNKPVALHLTIDDVENSNKTEEFSLAGNDVKFAYELFYAFKIVASMESFETRYLENTVEQLVKHAVLKHFAAKFKTIKVKVVEDSLSGKTIEEINSLNSTYPIELRLAVKSDFEISAKEVTASLSDFAINKHKCEFSQEKRTVVCVSHSKDSDSLLRLSDFWIRVEDEHVPKTNALLTLEDFLSENPSWIIALVVIGCILAIFFIGCIIAICYARKPYRRSGKVYELETTARQSQHIQQMPSIYPTTKLSTVQKPKEVYY